MNSWPSRDRSFERQKEREKLMIAHFINEAQRTDVITYEENLQYQDLPKQIRFVDIDNTCYILNNPKCVYKPNHTSPRPYRPHSYFYDSPDDTYALKRKSTSQSSPTCSPSKLFASGPPAKPPRTLAEPFGTPQPNAEQQKQQCQPQQRQQQPQPQLKQGPQPQHQHQPLPQLGQQQQSRRQQLQPQPQRQQLQQQPLRQPPRLQQQQLQYHPLHQIQYHPLHRIPYHPQQEQQRLQYHQYLQQQQSFARELFYG